MSEQLPDGLDLAVEMIATHVEGEVYGRSLTPSALLKKRQGVAAIAAIKSEHAQRVTLQHHAADLAQQIADLTTKEFDMAAANAALLERARTLEGDNQRRLFIQACEALADLGTKLGLDDDENDPPAIFDAIEELQAERDELRARLAEIEAQEPVAFSKAGNLFWCGNPQDWHGVDCSLYTRPIPAQAVPDGWRLVLTEARDLFAAYAESHLARGPEHAAKAARNEGMAAKINAALAAAPEHKSTGCGACGDACAKRGSCRLADESPEAAR